MGVLRGHILDQTGALIPGAQVTVTTAKGVTVGTATANAAGAYAVRGLPAGSYIVQVTYTGFAPFVSAPIDLDRGTVEERRRQDGGRGYAAAGDRDRR